MATAHLIAGPVGAGKTTYALQLASDARAVPFTIDDWMVTLFWPDVEPGLGMAWALPRVGRCEAQIGKIVCRLLRLEVDVVLDLGFMRRDHRDDFRRRVRAAGGVPRLHVVSAEAEVRRERVRARNRARAGTFAIEVTDEMFDWAEGLYEPPTGDEVG